MGRRILVVTGIMSFKTQRNVMRHSMRLVRYLPGCFIAVLALFLFAGCQSGTEWHSDNPASVTAATTTVTVPPADMPAPTVASVPTDGVPPTVTSAPTENPAPAVAATPPTDTPAPTMESTPAAAAPVTTAVTNVISGPVPPPIRIKAGLFDSLTDSGGNVWLPDQGFADGETAERPDVKVANTTTPAIYQSERYSMTSFSYPVPNGKYVVKLHFAETYDGITGPAQRVFSFNVEGQEFKDFDVWVKAGGPMRACIETVNVEVTNGRLDITFTPNVENPEINAIEILPGN